MRKRTIRLLLAALCLAAFAGSAAPAPAAVPTGQIVAVFGNAPFPFATPRVVVIQGNVAVFHNLDTVLHNVTSTTRGLFASATIGFAKSSTIAAVAKLKPGTYNFYCTLHAAMKGQLIVKKA
jgi:plastocyanin